jgi:hypothetical protein
LIAWEIAFLGIVYSVLFNKAVLYNWDPPSFLMFDFLERTPLPGIGLLLGPIVLGLLAGRLGRKCEMMGCIGGLIALLSSVPGILWLSGYLIFHLR